MDSTIDNELKRGRSYCLRLLAISPRTEGEVSSRLLRKGYSEAASRDIIDSLKKSGLIDDGVFARDWVERRQSAGPRSRRMLKEELARKNVDEDIIEKVFSEMSDETDDAKTASVAAEIKMAKLDGEPSDKVRGKVFRYLLSRGFGPETAEEAVRKVLDEDR